MLKELQKLNEKFEKLLKIIENKPTNDAVFNLKQKIYGTPDSQTPPIQDSNWKTVFKNLEDWNSRPPLSRIDIKRRQRIYLLENQIERLTNISSELINESKTIAADVRYLSEKVRHLIEILGKK